MQGQPQRGDDIEAWLKRYRDGLDVYDAPTQHIYDAINGLIKRYRECADYGLTLRPEDEQRGDP